MNQSEEPKYGLDVDGRIFNRNSGELIPLDEPVFILKADATLSVSVLEYYYGLCKDEEHRHAVSIRIDHFNHWQYSMSQRGKPGIPMMVFRARDTNAVPMLDYYFSLAKGEWKGIIEERLDEFLRFAKKFPERMKEPDTKLQGPFFKGDQYDR